MMLDTTDRNRVIRDHVGQDQLTATGSTTDHSCTELLPTRAPARYEIIGRSRYYAAVFRYILNALVRVEVGRPKRGKYREAVAAQNEDTARRNSRAHGPQ